MKKKGNDLSYLNLLKFLGAIVISIFLHYKAHFLYFFDLASPFKKDSFFEYLSQKGNLFVIFFFMASGILFFKVYFKRIIQGVSLKSFIISRIIRIFPLVIITSIYMYLMSLVLYKYNKVLWFDGSLSIWDLFSDIVFGGKAIFGLNNTLNSPIWYIGILMFCYLISYFLTQIYYKKQNFSIFLIPVFLGLLMYNSNRVFPLWNNSIAGGLINFFSGVILGWLLERVEKLNTKDFRLLKKTLFIELIFFIILLTKRNHNLYMDNEYLTYSFLLFPELIVLFYKSNFIYKICSNKVIDFAGKISYGVYLWNFPILITLHFLVINNYLSISVVSWQFIVLNFTIHIFVATVSYFLVDNKIVSWLKSRLKI